MPRLLLGVLALAVGLLLGLGDAFLAAWTAAAGDASDIAARGPWLLALWIPYFTAIAVAIAVVTPITKLLADETLPPT